MRFVAVTGEAMGMNMISKGTNHVLDFLKIQFPDMLVISLSSNFCTDKKPSAVNWIRGRGKSVVSEATIPADIVKVVLKTEPIYLEKICKEKNLKGSALAGSIGG